MVFSPDMDFAPPKIPPEVRAASRGKPGSQWTNEANGRTYELSSNGRWKLASGGAKAPAKPKAKPEAPAKDWPKPPRDRTPSTKGPKAPAKPLSPTEALKPTKPDSLNEQEVKGPGGRKWSIPEDKPSRKSPIEYPGRYYPPENEPQSGLQPLWSKKPTGEIGRKRDQSKNLEDALQRILSEKFNSPEELLGALNSPKSEPPEAEPPEAEPPAEPAPEAEPSSTSGTQNGFERFLGGEDVDPSEINSDEVEDYYQTLRQERPKPGSDDYKTLQRVQKLRNNLKTTPKPPEPEATPPEATPPEATPPEAKAPRKPKGGPKASPAQQKFLDQVAKHDGAIKAENGRQKRSLDALVKKGLLAEKDGSYYRPDAAPQELAPSEAAPNKVDEVASDPQAGDLENQAAQLADDWKKKSAKLERQLTQEYKNKGLDPTQALDDPRYAAAQAEHLYNQQDLQYQQLKREAEMVGGVSEMAKKKFLAGSEQMLKENAPHLTPEQKDSWQNMINDVKSGDPEQAPEAKPQNADNATSDQSAVNDFLDKYSKREYDAEEGFSKLTPEQQQQAVEQLKVKIEKEQKLLDRDIARYGNTKKVKRGPIAANISKMKSTLGALEKAQQSQAPEDLTNVGLLGDKDVGDEPAIDVPEGWSPTGQSQDDPDDGVIMPEVGEKKAMGPHGRVYQYDGKGWKKVDNPEEAYDNEYRKSRGLPPTTKAEMDAFHQQEKEKEKAYDRNQQEQRAAGKDFAYLADQVSSGKEVNPDDYLHAGGSLEHLDKVIRLAKEYNKPDIANRVQKFRGQVAEAQSKKEDTGGDLEVPDGWSPANQAPEQAKPRKGKSRWDQLTEDIEGSLDKETELIDRAAQLAAKLAPQYVKTLEDAGVDTSSPGQNPKPPTPEALPESKPKPGEVQKMPRSKNGGGRVGRLLDALDASTEHSNKATAKGLGAANQMANTIEELEGKRGQKALPEQAPELAPEPIDSEDEDSPIDVPDGWSPKPSAPDAPSGAKGSFERFLGGEDVDPSQLDPGEVEDYYQTLRQDRPAPGSDDYKTMQRLSKVRGAHKGKK